jgi:hypothetical protein
MTGCRWLENRVLTGYDFKVLRESTFIMPRGDEDIKGGAPKYFLALKGEL